LHPARHRAVLVAAEIVTGPGPQQRAYLQQVVGGFVANPVRPLAPVDVAKVTEIVAQLARDSLRREDIIDQSGRYRAAYHAVIFGAILGDDDAAMLLDRVQAKRAVAAGAREDYAGCKFAGRFGQRHKETVDRLALAAPLDRRIDLQFVTGQGQGDVWRNDIDRVGLDLGSVLNLYDRERADAAEKLRQDALMLGVEMLDDDKSEAAIGRDFRDQGLQGADPAGRGADADDRDVRPASRRALIFVPGFACRHLRRRPLPNYFR